MRNGDDGAVACDFYHRYREDMALMRELGIDGFRLSMSWPRIVPEGRGRVERCRARLLRPARRRAARRRDRAVRHALPLGSAAGARGSRRLAGARDRGRVRRVRRGRRRRLGDRVQHWITHNEPWVVAWLGYGWGMHAPGRTSERDALAAAHHLLLSHGRAVEILRRESPGARSGSRSTSAGLPRLAERAATSRRHAHIDGLHNRWFLDPLFRGAYPADLLEHFGASAPPIEDGDMEPIAAPIDFLGRQLLHAARSSRRPTDGGRPSPSTCPTPSTRTWAGRSIRTGSTTCSSHCGTSTRRRRST